MQEQGRRSVKTPCKINLHLGIHAEKDKRGYHRVDSVMVPVGLYNTITVCDASELVIEHAPALDIAGEKTAVWKAATMLAAELGCEPNVSIKVENTIPDQAGLGGSSADAAATLRALAERWGIDALDSRVVAVARRVGADVSFFLHPVPSLFLNAGDVLEEAFPKIVGMPLVLVLPKTDGVSTTDAYDAFDVAPTQPKEYRRLCDLLRAGVTEAEYQQVADLLYNNLAPSAKALCPEVAEIERWLSARSDVVGAMVSGSGSCSFAICTSHESAKKIVQEAQSLHGWRAFATMTVGFDG